MNFFLSYSLTDFNDKRKTHVIILKGYAAAHMFPTIVCKDSDWNSQQTLFLF